MINTDLKNAGTKVFSRFNANVWARLDKITYKAFKLNSRLSIIFPHSVSIFQTFSRSGKLLGWLRQEFKTLYEPRGVLYCLVVLFLLLYVICALVTTEGTQDCSFTRIDKPEKYQSYNIPDGIPLPASLFPFSPTAK